MEDKLNLPKWHKELDTYRCVCSTFIIEGNVYDMQAMINEETNQYRRVGIQQYLSTYFRQVGYKYIGFYNRIDGFSNIDELKTFFPSLFCEGQGVLGRKKGDITNNEAIIAVRNVLQNNDVPSVIVIEFAAFLHSDPNRLEEAEIENWGSLFLGSLNNQVAKYEDEEPLNNLLVLVTNKINDIPAWFYVSNPYCKVIHISKPNKDIRKRLFQRKAITLEDYNLMLNKGEVDVKADAFANLTEGFTNIELDGVIKLCKDRKISVLQIKKAIDLFKYGEQESRWDLLDINKIKNAQLFLGDSVIGQPHAVKKVTDVLFRSISGLSGIQSNSYGHPKGVLFFAGPTGTGKTEMAKKIAQLIFDDENAITRFDMSEYNLEHSNQRLIGAPPGYVGYSAGGQLTNAVKENPFSVLLFDEIDTAHPHIMDTFLQILEDGRITDSAGETVYFSECIIIFTSNVGMRMEGEEGTNNYVYPETISPDMPYMEIEEKLITNVASYFKYINRREIYNRIGGNLVVFDFIRREEAITILKKKTDDIVKKLIEEKGIELILTRQYLDTISERLSLNSEYGGRGVVTHIEECLVKPLGCLFVKENIYANKKIEIRDINDSNELEYIIF
jgi:DNA polymerase III delta prime subunit